MRDWRNQFRRKLNLLTSLLLALRKDRIALVISIAFLLVVLFALGEFIYYRRHAQQISQQALSHPSPSIVPTPI
ncbi:MAG: hypothetical protein ACRD4L_10085, partial [Pyrinomonadaceae bacterium]